MNKSQILLVILGIVFSQIAVAALAAVKAPDVAFILPAAIGVAFVAIASRQPKKATASGK